MLVLTRRTYCSSLPKGIDTDYDFERVIDINLLGSVRIARRFLPLLISSDGAKTYIVITSLAAHMVHSQFTPIAYNVSKRGVCHLVEQMAVDHGKDGVLSYAVCSLPFKVQIVVVAVC